MNDCKTFLFNQFELFVKCRKNLVFANLREKLFMSFKKKIKIIKTAVVQVQNIREVLHS